MGGMHGYGDCVASESYRRCVPHAFRSTTGLEVVVFAVAAAIAGPGNWISGDLVLQARKVRKRHSSDSTVVMTSYRCVTWIGVTRRHWR